MIQLLDSSTARRVQAVLENPPRVSLKRLGHEHYPSGHLSAWASDTYSITERVGAWALPIRPPVSIWYLQYHWNGWGMSTTHQATCQHLIPRVSLKRLGHEHYPSGHLSASDTYSITETVGAWALPIRPPVSIWYLQYHWNGWDMSTTHQATCHHLIPTVSLKRLGHEHYPSDHRSASDT